MDVLQQGRKPTVRHLLDDATAPVTTRPGRKTQHMRMGSKEPHGRPQIWPVAVIIICLASMMDPITADIIATALAAWAMTSSHR